MLKYEKLSKETEDKIREAKEKGTPNPYAFDETKIIRRNPDFDKANLIRTACIRDIDKIMHCPYYNRYADKTQVFSFYKNDDITRRALHVQLVSRIARTIGKALGLNQDLIEAISLGHDIGHTPFGHTGEWFLDELLCEHTGRRFNHNIHSVRVFDGIFNYNISLQTLNGVASHNGELELSEYRPRLMKDFDEFDKVIESCYVDSANIKTLIPDTLEGCVMRISDIIAYLGKDRQDAERARLIGNAEFDDVAIGSYNAEIINNLIVNIVEHSFGKPYIAMDEEHFAALKKAKADNGRLIYGATNKVVGFEDIIKPMMRELYELLLEDLKQGKKSSPIFTHHIDFVNKAFYNRREPYMETEYNQIVVDYIASMTDDYFIDLYAYLFPKSKKKIEYRGYFD